MIAVPPRIPRSPSRAWPTAGAHDPASVPRELPDPTPDPAPARAPRPLGRPWPIEDAYGRDVAIVAGGIGLAPLRGLLDQVVAEADRFKSIRVYLGARTPRDRLFVAEMEAHEARGLDIRATVDRAGPEWLGRVGSSRTSSGREATGADVHGVRVGPERMMTAVVKSWRPRRPARAHVGDPGRRMSAASAVRLAARHPVRLPYGRCSPGRARTTSAGGL